MDSSCHISIVCEFSVMVVAVFDRINKATESNIISLRYQTYRTNGFPYTLTQNKRLLIELRLEKDAKYFKIDYIFCVCFDLCSILLTVELSLDVTQSIGDIFGGNHMVLFI